MKGPIIGPRIGDNVDGHKITKVWSTGLVDLEDRSSVMVEQLQFVAGDNVGVRFTIKKEQAHGDPHEEDGPIG